MNETGVKIAGFATPEALGLQQVLQGLTARTPKLMSSLAFQAGPIGESSNGRLGNAAEKRPRFTTSSLENTSFGRLRTVICNTHNRPMLNPFNRYRLTGQLLAAALVLAGMGIWEWMR